MLRLLIPLYSAETALDDVEVLEPALLAEIAVRNAIEFAVTTLAHLVDACA
jgi:hypothetical protein